MRTFFTILLVMLTTSCDGGGSQIANKNPEAATHQGKKTNPSKRRSGRSVIMENIRQYLDLQSTQEDIRALEISGGMKLYGVVYKKDYSGAQEVLKQGVARGSAEAAYLLGILYNKKDFTGADRALSQQYFEKACTQDHEAACRAIRTRQVRRKFQEKKKKNPKNLKTKELS
ncbi:MAG: sel1 repeat family protein [Alphaproteobacteria bacterium]|nr:MAG: sel1 repeat family protein [Alphaproteobacteria bacterium]